MFLAWMVSRDIIMQLHVLMCEHSRKAFVLGPKLHWVDFNLKAEK